LITIAAKWAPLLVFSKLTLLPRFSKPVCGRNWPSFGSIVIIIAAGVADFCHIKDSRQKTVTPNRSLKPCLSPTYLALFGLFPHLVNWNWSLLNISLCTKLLEASKGFPHLKSIRFENRDSKFCNVYK